MRVSYTLCFSGYFLLLVLFRMHCEESGEESSETESVYSLKCHISHEVNHLHEGLKHVSVFTELIGSYQS